MPDRSPATILLVDDEQEILVALSDLLEDEFRVLTAGSGAQGLEILAREPRVHVIISDQRMPEMPGDVFLARAREITTAEALLLSGYADLEAVINAVNNGRIAGYAPKPWEPAGLLSMVRGAVSRYRLAQALETEQALLQGLMASSAAAVSFKDEAGEFVRLNAAKAQSLGRSVEECLHRREADMLDPPAQEALLAAEAAALESGLPAEQVEQRQQDGMTRWVRVTRTPIRNRGGQITHLAVLEQDITDQRNLEQRLHQSEKMQALGTMAGGVAHDFNNLLTAILGTLELLTRIEDGDSRRQRLLRNAIMAAERGSSLTQRLLSFSRKRDLQLQPTVVDSLLRDTEDLIQRSIGNGIGLRWHLAPELWQAMVDPEQLSLAVLNLCINSRDAMEQGGTITISTRNVSLADGEAADLPSGDYVSIAVTDDGAGMAPAVLRQAFEPFFTTKEVGRGTGLGLSMVYGLSRQSGGTTLLSSEPGRGTTVELLLPRARRPRAEAKEEDGQPAAGAARARIMVVDDDPGVRSITTAFLTDLGHQVTEVPSGEAALATLEQGAGCDLVVTDLVMPGMSGVELARRLRATYPCLPLLVLTGYADPELLPEGLPLLRKPFRQNELAGRVAALLDPARG
ncbi:response regulator [Pseudoroseomonas sp. WGS1072]|uniref:response regulator n=1 Tax=Roseomonas sp. WGS1072 TaxID=3366816 RepID=UPI003BF1C5C3